MDRRKFIESIIAATAALGSNSAYSAVRPNPPILFGSTPTATPSSIPMAVKRYDGGSGVATFNGVAYFGPGHLRSSDISQLSLWRDNTELPVSVAEMTGQHSDGSVKAVRVQTTLNVSGASPVDLELRIGAPPTTGPAVSIDPNRDWCRNMTLLYCTDPVHMCSSQVAPMPLIAFSDPRMPRDTVEFLTSGFNAWLADFDSSADRNAQNATYNWCYGKWCQYLCTGDPDALEYAVSSMMTFDSENPYIYNGDNRGGSGFPYSIPYFVRDDNGLWDPYGDMNPGQYVASGGGRNENTDCSMDAFAAYYATGSEFHRRLIQQQGRNWHWLLGDSSDPNQESYQYRRFSQPRYNYRRNGTPQLWAYLSGDNESKSTGNGSVNPRIDYAPGGRFPLQERVDEAYNRARAWNSSDFRYGVWGSSQDTDSNDTSPGVAQVFQYEVLPAFFVSYFNHVNPDNRIGPGLQATAAHIRSQWSGPHVIGGAPRYVQGSYGERDPSLVDPIADSQRSARSASLHYPYMNCHFMAWKFAYDGDSDARDVWDTMMSTPNPNIASPTYKTRKLTGQIFAMAFHGAAWRAGAPPLGMV